MRKPSKAIKLTSYDELLGMHENPASEDGLATDQIVEVKLTELYPFRGHPFLVLDDAKMEETTESIKNYGVLNPGLVRPRSSGGYELISGHRRKRGCELAGKETMPVIVRNYTDDEAVVVMVDANIQRENLLPSEKARAYKMKLEALKHQGKGLDGQEDTAALVGKKAGDSGRTVQRYIRLTELIPELLDMVDSGKIKFISGVALSYLSDSEQNWVLTCVTDENAAVSSAKADILKKCSESGELAESDVRKILCEKERRTVKLSLPAEKIKRYFPENYSKQQMEQIIYELLEAWKNDQ